MDMERRREYWRRNIRLKAVLLTIWFVVSYGCGILFVEQLNEITILDFPLGFWFAQQGAIATFIVLVAIYALRMDRLDEEFGVVEESEAERVARVRRSDGLNGSGVTS
ncbi:MAG: DUF4212 domain-containing protein [Actinomycetota bacterium]|nr:DUF4212 domain-containing protein [Actinomycetota bacterium]